MSSKGSFPDRSSPPSDDELEVSLFGRGVGECVVVHIGAGDWLIVDSCVNPDTDRPVALEYLEGVGVDPAIAISRVIISHWDHDHIRGASAVLEAATSSKLYCSAAMNTAEARRHIAAADMDHPNQRHEMFRLRDTLASRASAGQRRESITPELAVAQTIVFERIQGVIGPDARAVALSPSSATLGLALHELFPKAPSEKEPKRRTVAQLPNQLSVVLQVSVGDAVALLGGDLENTKNPATGWQAVVTNHKASGLKAHTFKIPHHGSKNAHNDDVWNQMLHAGPVSVLAPFLAGPKPLPSPSDLERIKALTPELYSTTRPKPGRPKSRTSAVDKTAKQVARSRRLAEGKLGQVRVRVSGDGTVSTVQCFDAAVKL